MRNVVTAEGPRTLIHVPGSCALKYTNGDFEGFIQNPAQLELLDSYALFLRDKKPEDVNLVRIRKQILNEVVELGKKSHRLASGSTKYDLNKQIKLRKLQAEFRAKGKNLLKIIEADLAQERRAAEEFDKMTDQEKEKLVEEVLAGR